MAGMSSAGMREESVQRAKAVFNTIKGWLVSMNASGPHQGPGVPEKVRDRRRLVPKMIASSGRRIRKQAYWATLAAFGTRMTVESMHLPSKSHRNVDCAYQPIAADVKCLTL
jgi:hypothetical protein